MAKRWQRVRRGTSEGDDADEQPDAPDEVEDLETRLGPLPSSFQRPPTPEELRAAFSRKRRPKDDDDRPDDDFASRFPTETLFVATSADDLPFDDHVGGEDRSRTTGDYYYDPEDAWAVLGVHPGASWREITAAHRRLAMQHHPDRLLDASPEQRAASEETMREINVAYNVLRRLTGH